MDDTSNSTPKIGRSGMQGSDMNGFGADVVKIKRQIPIEVVGVPGCLGSGT